VDPSGESEQRCLTSGSFDETYPRWHPSGERLAFISDREPRRGLVSGTDVWELDLGSGETTRAAPRGDWIMPSYRPDGVLHLIGHPQTDYPRNYGLWRREEDGYHDVGGHLDRSVYSIMLRTAGEPRWLGRSAFCPLEDGGRMKLVRLDPDGAAEALVDGDRVVTGIDAGGSGRLVFTASTGTDPGELWELVDGKERMLTDLRPKDLELQPIRHWTFPSGSHEIDAFAVLPLGEGPFPVLLNIHGGPATQYGFGFFDEFQVYAGAGFAVVACNPRGSAGRGLEFMRAVRGEGWGRVDLDDITALLVSALDRFPQLDRQRLGIMGGSYGGFLTAWTIAHDHRFRSAIVERALLSVPSFAGTSDIAVDFPPNYLESSDWVTWWEKSPLRLAHQVRTPTLIIHSEDDLRCPIEQAEQFFLALLRNQVEVELMRFPGEGHELSRSGKPRHRVERLKAVIDWHRRHLGQAVPN
jgi:dipeptidyl aminopeptidase/acylaminoacyl peptidase